MTLWIVKAEFDRREDAQAALDLLEEIGVEARLSNTRRRGSIQPIEKTRCGKLVLSNIPAEFSTLEKLFVEHGFAKTSVSPAVSDLLRAGLVRKNGRRVEPVRLLPPPSAPAHPMEALLERMNA